MEEKTLVGLAVYMERNFAGIDAAGRKVVRTLNKQAKTISNVAGLCGIGFLCAAWIFSIQDKQIKELYGRTDALKKAQEPVEEGENDGEN